MSDVLGTIEGMGPGDCEDILDAVRARFALGWGRSMDCDRGCWPIIAQLHRDIAAIVPDYEVHEIKESSAACAFPMAPGRWGTTPESTSSFGPPRRSRRARASSAARRAPLETAGSFKTLCADHSRDGVFVAAHSHSQRMPCTPGGTFCIATWAAWCAFKCNSAT